MRLLRRIFMVYIVVAIVLGITVAALDHRPAHGGSRPSRGSATWIDHHWVGTSPSDTSLDGLCRLLRRHTIDEIYVHVGPLDGSGHIVPGRAPYAARFATRFHARCPRMLVLAWIGQLLPVWDGILDLRVAGTRTALVTTSNRFVAMGFDGVQYDLEPVANDDAAFLDLLRRTRAALRGHLLAVATPALLQPAGTLPHPRLPLTPWSRPYYAQVAALAGELDPMLYVTSLRSPADYTRFVADQVRDIVPLSTHPAQIRPALPAYNGHDPLFDDQVENLSTGLAGIAQAFPPTASLPSALAGIAIYPLWEMTAARWDTLDQWQARSRYP